VVAHGTQERCALSCEHISTPAPSLTNYDEIGDVGTNLAGHGESAVHIEETENAGVLGRHGYCLKGFRRAATVSCGLLLLVSVVTKSWMHNY
jgi:hypothetical protein